MPAVHSPLSTNPSTPRFFRIGALVLTCFLSLLSWLGLFKVIIPTLLLPERIPLTFIAAAMALKLHISFALTMVIFFNSTTQALSSPTKLATSTISAAPAFQPNSQLPLPAAPVSSPPLASSSSPNLAPDITPQFPTPNYVMPGLSPSVLPTIPSTQSPPNPDQTAGPGLNVAKSPQLPTAMSSSTSGSAAVNLGNPAFILVAVVVSCFADVLLH